MVTRFKQGFSNGSAARIHISMKTYQPKAGEIDRRWLLVDAQGQTLGRLASRVAMLLRGKHKPAFAPHADVGDFVVVINAEKVAVTGRKLRQKVYHHHSQYPGGLKSVRMDRLLKERPERVLRNAVRGMLPKNKLGDALFGKLRYTQVPPTPMQLSGRHL